MANRRQHRRRWPIFLLIVVLLSVWFVWEQESIVTEVYEITAPGLPEPFDGLRIVQLSDLHGKQFGQDNARLLKAVAALKPDLIAITGDLIDQESQCEALPALARGLSDIAPTYYVTGNHEWAVRQVPKLKELLSENGVTPLTNEYVTLELNQQTIVLAGIDDPNGPADQKTGPELRAEIASNVGADAYTILLAHRDSVEDYAAWGYSLTFCGHGHGGIFRIPIANRGLLSTDRTFFPKYDGGLFLLDDCFCVVSRGLGSNTVPFQMFRLFNRPDLPLVILHAG